MPSKRIKTHYFLESSPILQKIVIPGALEECGEKSVGSTKQEENVVCFPFRVAPARIPEPWLSAAPTRTESNRGCSDALPPTSGERHARKSTRRQLEKCSNRNYTGLNVKFESGALKGKHSVGTSPTVENFAPRTAQLSLKHSSGWPLFGSGGILCV